MHELPHTPFSVAAPGAKAETPPSDRVQLPETGFVRQKMLLRFVPFSRSTLWRHVKARRFPMPVRLSEGITAWRAEEVRQWIQDCQ